MGCFSNVYGPGLDEAVLVRASAILARAEARVKGTQYAENAHLARIPVDFTRVLRGAARPSLSRKDRDLAKWLDERDAARRLVEIMDRPDGLSLCDDLAGRTAFTARIRALATKETPEKPGRLRLTLDETHLTGSYPATVFRYVEDPLARDGKAILLPGKAGACTAWLDFQSLDLDADGLYIPRIRVRASPCGRDVLPFRAGVYNRIFRRVVNSFGPDAIDIQMGVEKYRWYTLGVVSPTMGDTLWIGLGDAGDPNAAVPDVWIDRVEIVRIQ